MSWSHKELGWFVAYYILAAISITGAILVVISIIKSTKSRTTFSTTVLCLHLSLSVNEFSLLPYVFSGDDTICIIAEVVHYYCTMMNYFALFVIIQAHLFNVLSHWRSSVLPLLEKYSTHMIFIPPLMIFFRFLDARYRDNSYPWCSIHSSASEPLYFCTYTLWMWLILGSCTVEVVYATIYIYRSTDSFITWRFVSTIGFYLLIGLGGFLPNVVITSIYTSADDDGSFSLRIGSYLPIYISGILYTWIFFRDREAIENFELYRERSEGISEPSFNPGDILSVVEEVANRNQHEEYAEEGFALPSVPITTNPMQHHHKY